jgi:hypothetical protein
MDYHQHIILLLLHVEDSLLSPIYKQNKQKKKKSKKTCQFFFVFVCFFSCLSNKIHTLQITFAPTVGVIDCSFEVSMKINFVLSYNVERNKVFVKKK